MKKVVITLSIFTCLSLNAGIDDTLKKEFGSVDSFFDDYVTGIENPTAIRGQTRGLYSLGGVRVRMKDTGSFRPFSATMPSLKFGCGGIDAVMGSFGYLDPDRLVEKLKAIVAQAPAFAFQIALSMLDKETQSIMQEIEKVLQAFNSFQIDSCKASKNLSNWAMSQFEDGTQANLSGGASESYMQTKEGKSWGDIAQGWADSANSFFNGDNAKAKESVNQKILQGSLITRAIENSSLTGLSKGLIGKDPSGGDLLESFVRNLVGDLIGYKEGTGGDFKPKIKIIPMGTQNSIEVFVNGGNLPFAYYKHSENASKVNPSPTYGTKTDFKGIKKIFEERINSILTEMRTNTRISADNRKFINSLPLPIYNFLNTQAQRGSAEDSLLAEYLAIMESQAFFSTLLGSVGKSIREEVSKNEDDNYEKAKNIALSIVKSKEFMDSEFQTILSKFQSKKSLVEQYKTYQREIESTIGVF